MKGASLQLRKTPQRQHPPIIYIWGQHTLSDFSVDHPKRQNDPCVSGCSVLELGQTKLFVLPLRDTSQRTGSTAAQPGAGGPSGSRWLSKKQTLEESGKSVKADTTLPIRLKTHWRMQRADKGQGSNGPITSWLLFRWLAHSGQEPNRPWSLRRRPYEVTAKTHWNPTEPNAVTKRVERWRKPQSCYTNDKSSLRRRTNSTRRKSPENIQKTFSVSITGWGHGRLAQDEGGQSEHFWLWRLLPKDSRKCQEKAAIFRLHACAGARLCGLMGQQFQI